MKRTLAGAAAVPILTVTIALAEVGGSGGDFPVDGPMTPASSPPRMAEPELFQTEPFTDLGTVVTRASNSRHHYAKTSVWNSDESYALVHGTSQLIDGATYRVLRVLDLPNEHRTWANADPNYIYGIQRPNQWQRTDVRTGRVATLHTFPARYGTISFGGYEGNMDDRDRYVCLMTNVSGDRGRAGLLFDVQRNREKCAIDWGSRGRDVLDCTMTHDGEHVLVSNYPHGVDSYSAKDCSFERQVTPNSTHMDACVDASGNQVVVQADDGHTLYMADVVTGRRTKLYASNTTLRFHVSCRNTARPGWAYLSHYCSGGTGDPRADGYDKGYAVRLDPARPGVVEIFAWLHVASDSCTYDREPMLVPSRHGDRVWWKGNWDGTSSGTHSFVARSVRSGPERRGDRTEAP